MKVVFQIMLVIFLSGCMGNVQVKEDRWNSELAKNVPIGTTKEEVEAYLESTGNEYSYFEGDKTYYVGDRDVTSDLMFYTVMISITISMDEEDKVKNYLVDRQYDGL